MDDSINIELHAREKRSLLRSLFAFESEHPPGSTVMVKLLELCEKSGLSPEAAQRAATALQHEGLVMHGGAGYYLTPKGREFTLTFLHEEALPGWRKLRRRLESPAITAALVATSITILGASDLPWWVRALMRWLH